MDFKQGSQSYTLEAALDVAQQRSMVNEHIRGFHMLLYCHDVHQGSQSYRLAAVLEVAEQRDTMNEQVRPCMCCLAFVLLHVWLCEAARATTVMPA